ncbi:MAG TPA: alpha-hydroxy-acid oxidizing protein [Caulobacteraceae bacterium]|jgi:lactate 2-monooxygenase|nr:alpha-hydroxy-acid oxidizing protein [Caulobacteraceae bacterium]
MSDPGPGLSRQAGVYMRGLQGVRETTPLDFAGLESAAQAKLTPEAFAYIAGGAGRETTAAANRTALDRWRITPRMARDCSMRDLTLTLFGRKLPAPILTAPIGVLSMAHPEADLAVARAAASAGAPMIISNQASYPMEQIADCCGASPKWFQLYWGKSDALVASLVKRAEACGCEAIVVTLDTTVLGWRVRDLALGHLPFLRGQGIAQYTSDPVFRAMLPETPEKNPLGAAAMFTQIYSDPSLTWEKLKTLRRVTQLPILVKGIQHPEDAALALQHGFDGVVVSNHGGRQVDGAVGSADQLLLCAERIGGKIPVLFDSGVRSGADVFKALALGADAVCVGRPYVYGLAVGGQAGVEAVLSNLTAELDLTLALAGWTSASQLGRDALSPV